MISNSINFDHIFLNMSAPNQKQLFKNIASSLSKKTGLSEHKLLLKFINQEKKENSAIGNGVAISHLQFSKVEIEEPQIILCRFQKNKKKRAEFTTPDSLPIDLFCIVLSPKENSGSGLQLVSSLSRIMNDPFLCDQLRCLKDSSDIYQVMNERQIIRHAA